MTTLQNKLTKLLEEYETVSEEKRKFLSLQIESIQKAIEYYSSPKYLNRKFFQKEKTIMDLAEEAEHKSLDI